ncbi:YdeI/OmpD-associated family protein [Ferruginibacter paludis]|uniref:YdeI/OmpD-associated family protein n=1 Tax=Ferruginibacter paludis TaxID=1310417 RepID=UPI0025B57C9A|nr:YdeI/OmpD-associated family protein [Ferruginibacter paludis]MDN3655985.1 YdeI/OmpD-associated family protein [Ferruginibacter paludis]
MKKLLVNEQYQIKKQAGKGGWNYVVITAIPADKRNHLGLIRVSGFIDTYELKQFNLLPMKDGNMMLPLKTVVRKQIAKKDGDQVHVKLYTDDSPVVIPDEILLCLLDSPKAHQFFLSLTSSNQKYYIDWIEDAKRLETKAERIIKTIGRLEKGLKFYDWLRKEL